MRTLKYKANRHDSSISARSSVSLKERKFLGRSRTWTREDFSPCRNGRAIMDLYVAHREVYLYLKKAPWVPAHMVERYHVLTGRAEEVFDAFLTEGLTKTEESHLFDSVSSAARDNTKDLTNFLHLLLAEARREQESSDTYASLQAKFAQRGLTDSVEDNDFNVLNSEYQSFMSNSRVEF